MSKCGNDLFKVFQDLLPQTSRPFIPIIYTVLYCKSSQLFYQEKAFQLLPKCIHDNV